MKISPLLVILTLSCLLTAQADVESDRAALRVIKVAYEEACKAGNPEKLAPHLAKEATGVMVTGEEVVGLEGIKRYWAKIQSLMGPGGSYSTAITVENTDFFGEIAISRGTTDDLVRVTGGKELKFNSRWTAICQRENGTWKIFRMQASLDPIQNVFVSGRVAGAKLGFGIGGGVIGLILGPLLLRLRQKKQIRTQ